MSKEAAKLNLVNSANTAPEAAAEKPVMPESAAINLENVKQEMQNVRAAIAKWNDAKLDLWATHNADVATLDRALAAAKEVQAGYEKLKLIAGEADMDLASKGFDGNDSHRTKAGEMAQRYNKEIADFAEQIRKIEAAKMRVGVKGALEKNSWDGVRDKLIGTKQPDMFPMMQEAAAKGEGTPAGNLHEKAPMSQMDYGNELTRLVAKISEDDDFFKPFLEQGLVKRDEKTGKIKMGFLRGLFQGGLAKQVADYNALIDKQSDYSDKFAAKRDSGGTLHAINRRRQGFNPGATITGDKGERFELTGSENPEKVNAEWAGMVAQAEKGEGLGKTMAETTPEAHPFNPNEDYLGAIERMTAARRKNKALEQIKTEQAADEEFTPEGNADPEMLLAFKEARQKRAAAEAAAAAATKTKTEPTAAEQKTAESNFDLGVTFQNIAGEISSGEIGNRETLAAALRRDGLMNAQGDIKNAGEGATMDFEEMFEMISKKAFLGLGARKFDKTIAMQFFDNLAARYLDQKMGKASQTRLDKFKNFNVRNDKPMAGGLFRG